MSEANFQKFRCLTCDYCAEAQDMMKHLSATRHKTILALPSKEEVCCEECQNNNVHLLQIIRFGGEDIDLLCSSCFSRDYAESEKPSTVYSLANGSLLRNWERYVKVRDCCCVECGKESKLNVNKKGSVLCDMCLSKKDNVKDYVSESSGKFLYALLGIQDVSNGGSLHKKGGRKLGRGQKGKGRTAAKARKPREKKPLTRLEEMAKDAYETKKVNSIISSDSNISLRSFRGIKASKNDAPNGEQGSNVNRHTNQVKQGKSMANREAKSEPKSSTKSKRGQANPSSKPKSAQQVHPNLKTSAKTKPSSKGEKKITIEKQSGGSEHGTRKSKAPVSVHRPTSTSNNRPGKPSARSEQTKTGKFSSDRLQAKHSKVSGGKNSASKSTGKSDTNNKDPAKTFTKPPIKPKGVEQQQIPREEITSVEDFEEGEPIKRFTQYVPKKSYSTIEDYFNEFSFALFLEGRLENDFLQEFQITWPKNAQEQAFVVNMKADSAELKKLLPPNLVKLGRLPFTNQQPLMLTNQDETNVWYTYVRELESRKNNITLLLELYSWNKLPLPIKAGNSHFKLLPCSAQVNRIMFAMTRVQNPKFIKLLLGQESIKQLNFNNRLQFTKDSFNESQKAAIQHVLNNSITVLQGPPGTGKTSTIEEIILQLIENFHTLPILCVAASNIAIDNIAEKFMVNRPDIKILRIVSQSKEAQYNPKHMLGKICLHNIVYEQLPADMKDNISKLRSGIPGLVSKNQYNKLLSTQNAISDRYIAQAQIIFTTNIASGGRQLKAIRELPAVIMDESTQSSEVSTLVPLSLPGIKRFVFVGDEKQLSSFSNVPQLEMSLFERILTNGTYEKPHMLDTQYRMHPAISEFPIEKFYEGKLKDGVTSEDKKWPGIAYPLFFYQCNQGPENKVFNSKRGMRGFTYNNAHEAGYILAVLHKLILEKGVKRDEIGVITPYSSQRDLISEMLVKDPIVNPSGKAMEQEMDKDDALGGGDSVSGSANKVTINIVNGVYVATVDSFQGHEKSFVVFSCVRNNSENKIGFVKDRRRMNVALTRAKNGLVVVGNKDVMKKGDQLWADYIKYLEEKEVVSETLDNY
ncbi:LAQU0S06e00628g1_1 [Lachancea quebecensis]|uniref:LAQU0S06e00628g1_1 n=1 Tax=Lachancea quebecensis TaxID=1654605 RepID=A0A0N7MLK6_9SACH|nr:LAQU0S06e00628g1_1 [Lachancea quebecensis]